MEVLSEFEIDTFGNLVTNHKKYKRSYQVQGVRAYKISHQNYSLQFIAKVLPK